MSLFAWTALSPPAPSFFPPPLPVDSFALAAGLTSAVSSSSVIVLAVASELVAGAISMGLGGYLSGRVEADTHEAERLREVSEVEEKPWEEEEEVVDVLGRYGLTRAQCEPVLEHFRQNKELWGTLAGRRQGAAGGGGKAEAESAKSRSILLWSGNEPQVLMVALTSVTWILVSAVCRWTDPSCYFFLLFFQRVGHPILWSRHECPPSLCTCWPSVL